MSNSTSFNQQTPANTMYLTINGVPQLYYMLKQDEFMTLQSKANTNIVPPAAPIAPLPIEEKEEEEYIDRAKASKLLHVDKSTLWRWAKEGKLNFQKVGPRRVLYKMEDIKNLLNNGNRG